MYQVHPIPPLYDEKSCVLILGSFPSVKSREQGFFYGHPQNRFWRVLAALLNEPIPQSVDEKRQMILKHNLALWDVIGSCEITGSSDSSIRNVIPNDIGMLIRKSKINKIYVNGKTAEKYYIKYIEPQIGIKAQCLPSTSPANAAWSFGALLDAWKTIIE